MDMREQRFGIEIEMTGVTREQAAKVAAEYFGTDSHYDGTFYNTYSALDSQGRKWKFMSDASITPQRKSGRQTISASDEYKTEMVSPICRWEDIETVQELIRKLRDAGAITNSSCGIHVHVDASPFDANTLRNITNIMAAKEDMIYKALQVTVARQHRWCKPVDNRFLEELNRRRPKSLEQVSRIWYDGEDGRHEHYHDSRYHCLNLHSVFQKGTVEFRLFNSTTHAGKIKSYIQLCMAISAQALNQKCASRTKTQSTNEKYTFRTWLLRLGLIGDEFKTARLHLLEHLDGCIAWKNPAQAQQQKERLRQKKEKALEEAAHTLSPQLEQTIENEQEQAGVDEQSPGLSMSM
ncbi:MULTISPECIES: amidoligase family protein [Eubacteriales]|uniref:amidoligase family protein n=1 Tax=Eubacteriales TaxID=186802 RepID=UPI0012B29A9B|nr:MULTISPECIES: amidoligase family protein [Eubacteriales]MSS11790.1 virulence associated protein [Clostridium sp. WB02_MRS01]